VARPRDLESCVRGKLIVHRSDITADARRIEIAQQLLGRLATNHRVILQPSGIREFVLSDVDACKAGEASYDSSDSAILHPGANALTFIADGSLWREESPGS
jgi:hypothetical protein